MAAPKIDNSLVAAKLHSYDRTPFMDLLSRAIIAGPTEQSLRKFAQKAPDRWAQSVTQLAKLSGFSEKIEVVKDIHHWIHNASDADLMKKNIELERQLLELKGEAIEVVKEDDEIKVIEDNRELKSSDNE